MRTYVVCILISIAGDALYFLLLIQYMQMFTKNVELEKDKIYEY